MGSPPIPGLPLDWGFPPVLSVSLQPTYFYEPGVSGLLVGGLFTGTMFSLSILGRVVPNQPELTL